MKDEIQINCLMCNKKLLLNNNIDGEVIFEKIFKKFEIYIICKKCHNKLLRLNIIGKTRNIKELKLFIKLLRK